MKKSVFLVSFFSTIITILCNCFLVRLFFNTCTREVMTCYLSFFNVSSCFNFMVVHLLMFSYATQLVSKNTDGVFDFFVQKIKTCFVIVFIGSLLFSILIVPKVLYNYYLFFSILCFSFFITCFWGLNFVCFVFNKMSNFFASVCFLQILLYVGNVIFISKFPTLNCILGVYGFSYAFICLLLIKKLFPQKKLTSFLSILKKRTTYQVEGDINWYNFIFDILILLEGLKIFYASVLWEATLVMEFCLFWRFTEIGFVLLDRVVDSQQGVIVNMFIKKPLQLKNLFFKLLKVSILISFLGGVFYVFWGKYLLNIWLGSNFGFNIPITVWCCGALFFISYSILTVIKYFAFFTNNSQCIAKVFGLKVFLYLAIIVPISKHANPYSLLYVSLLDFIFIPFYWKALNRKLKLI